MLFRSRQAAQSKLVELGLLEVLQAMFLRLDWRPPPVAHHGQHGAGCSCSPQSCLQMQLLRTLQALCEKQRRLRLSPLGMDRYGARYWRLPAPPAPSAATQPPPCASAVYAESAAGALASHRHATKDEEPEKEKE